MRPDDGPVQGPKHVVLVINTPLPYSLCFDSTILYHLTLKVLYTFLLPASFIRLFHSIVRSSEKSE